MAEAPRARAAPPVLFAGPSTHGLDAAAMRAAGVEWRAPAQRGDIAALLRERPRTPGVILLADGVFQAVPAVGHAELCAALDAGWQVWGCSSLGAIRAWELRAEGMRGFGWVHAQFARHPDFRDDEMALLHAPGPLWLPLSEPLVNLRWAFERHGAALGIAPAAQRATLAALRRQWFGDRTLPRIGALLAARRDVAPGAPGALLQAIAGGERIKTLDLARLLAERPWVGHAMPAASGGSD